MYKVVVRLDEEKIIQDNQFTPEMLYAKINSYAKECHLINKNNFTYKGIGSKDDFGNCWKFIFTLRRQPWFVKYVHEWLWCESAPRNQQDAFDTDDLIFKFLNR